MTSEEKAYEYLSACLGNNVQRIELEALTVLFDQHAKEAKTEQRQMCADTVFVCNTDAGKTPLERRRILERACINAIGERG